MGTWVHALPASVVKLIGVAEILGAIGLIVPLLTGIQPWLTWLAAAALALVMLLAAAFHLSRQEGSKVRSMLCCWCCWPELPRAARDWWLFESVGRESRSTSRCTNSDHVLVASIIAHTSTVVRQSTLGVLAGART